MKVNGQNIKLLITDFDGTLVDTFKANYYAYKEVFAYLRMELDELTYKENFGYRFDKFMDEMNVSKEVRPLIREMKSKAYLRHFDKFIVNTPLLQLLVSFKKSGGKIAIASTARELNLYHALRYLQIDNLFDYVIAGEQVNKGKPYPEIYEKVLKHFGLSSSEAIVFEDTLIGSEAASNAGINYITINQAFYGN